MEDIWSTSQWRKPSSVEWVPSPTEKLKTLNRKAIARVLINFDLEQYLNRYAAVSHLCTRCAEEVWFVGNICCCWAGRVAAGRELRCHIVMWHNCSSCWTWPERKDCRALIPVRLYFIVFALLTATAVAWSELSENIHLFNVWAPLQKHVKSKEWRNIWEDFRTSAASEVRKTANQHL